MADHSASFRGADRQAVTGLWRVIGEDGWDGTDYVVADCPTAEAAMELATARSAMIAPAQARYGDTYFVYDDQGRCLYKRP